MTDAILVLGLLSEESRVRGRQLPAHAARRRRRLPRARRRPARLPRRGGGLRLLARREREHDPGGAALRPPSSGVDPRELALLAYGGNGPLFAAIQAQELGIRRVLVPKASPGVLGARRARGAARARRGALLPARRRRSADARASCARSSRSSTRAPSASSPPRATRAREVTARYQLNLRYPGQNWSLAVPVAERRGARDLSFVERGAAGARSSSASTARHERSTATRARAEEPEITGVRLARLRRRRRRRASRGGVAAPRREPAPARTRRANLGDGFEETAIHRGPDAPPGRRRARAPR